MVDYREERLESYLTDNPGAMLGTESAILLGRQVAVPHGRIDLLIFHTYLYIVELKARPLQEKDVCQVLRYMRDIKDLIWMHGNIYSLSNQYLSYRNKLSEADKKACDQKFHDMESLDVLSIDNRFVRPVLIGTKDDTGHTEDIASAMIAAGGITLHYTEPFSGHYEFYEVMGEVSIFEPKYSIGTLDWFHIFAKLSQNTKSPNDDLYLDVLPWENFHSALYKRNSGK